MRGSKMKRAHREFNRKLPWRNVISRAPRYPSTDYWLLETLECGHKHESENRAPANQAVRRRCVHCGPQRDAAKGTSDERK